MNAGRRMLLGSPTLVAIAALPAPIFAVAIGAIMMREPAIDGGQKR